MAVFRLKQEDNKVSIRTTCARKQKSAQRLMRSCQDDTEASSQRLSERRKIRNNMNIKINDSNGFDSL